MRCVYIDHTTEPVEALGGLHHRFVRDPPKLQVPGLLLHTCHRVEWYSKAEGSLPVPELASGKEIFGERAALSRLSKIASGVMSIVVGDSLVFRQVVEAGCRLERTSPARFTPRHGHICDQDILTQVIDANRAVEQCARDAGAWIDAMTGEVRQTP